MGLDYSKRLKKRIKENALWNWGIFPKQFFGLWCKYAQGHSLFSCS